MHVSPAVADRDLYQLAEQLGHALRTAGWRVATAESCTAGWIAKVLTDVPGSSAWVECGYVTYSNAAKIRDLAVPAAVIEAHGAVSEATVREMASGAQRASGADIVVAVSGIAGPDGGSPDKPVGTVWFAVAARSLREPDCGVQHFPGNRDAVRRQAVAHALRRVMAVLGGAGGP